MMWYVSHKSVDAPVEAITSALTEGEEVAIQWAELLEKKDNQVTLQINAEKAIVSDDRKSIKLTNFSMASYGEDGLRTTIIGREGNLDNDSKNIVATGNVLVLDQEGRAMYTDKLHWQEKDKSLWSDSRVRIFGGNFVVKGNALKVFTTTGNARISGGVTAIFERE